MKSCQKFNGRLWDPEQVLTVLGIHYGEVHPTGHAHKNAWRVRTLISSFRDYHNCRSGSATYGKDWKQYLKKEIVEFQRTGRLPYNVLRDGTPLVRAAEMTHWVHEGRPTAASRIERKKTLVLVRSVAGE